jgi:hypothetical protein
VQGVRAQAIEFKGIAVTYRFSSDSDYEPEKFEPEEAPGRGRWFPAMIAVGLAIVGSGSAFVWHASGHSGPAFLAFLNASSPAAADSVVGLKDLQAVQQQLVGQMQQATQVLGGQQAEIKRLSDQVTVLAGKLDTLQRSLTTIQTAPVSNPIVAPARKKPPAPKPAKPSPAGAPAPPLQLTH